VLAREQLHGVERELTVPLEFVDLHDIRMRETAHAIEFSLQSLHEIRAPFDAVAKHLDRHRCGTFGARDTQPGRRLVHLAHAAAAQQALHDIPIAQYTPDVDGRRIGRPLGVTRGGRCRRWGVCQLCSDGRHRGGRQFNRFGIAPVFGIDTAL
jgi:hypothetical protein